MKNTQINKEGIYIPLFLIAVMVIIQLFDFSGCYGIIPRHGAGLKGILLAPLFHGSWEHLFSNAVPLFVLSFIVFNFYKKLAYILLVFGWFLIGVLVWTFGNLGLVPSDTYIGCHIGASGLVYLLASFIFFSGIFRRSVPLIAVSMVVVFLYGGMIWGIFPEDFIGKNPHGNKISWESHLAGSIVGFFFAFAWRKIGPQKQPWVWNKTEYDRKKDERLWQKYLDEEAKRLGTLQPEKHFPSQNDFIVSEEIYTEEE